MFSGLTTAYTIGCVGKTLRYCMMYFHGYDKAALTGFKIKL